MYWYWWIYVMQSGCVACGFPNNWQNNRFSPHPSLCTLRWVQLSRKSWIRQKLVPTVKIVSISRKFMRLISLICPLWCFTFNSKNLVISVNKVWLCTTLATQTHAQTHKLLHFCALFKSHHNVLIKFLAFVVCRTVTKITTIVFFALWVLGLKVG